MTEVNLFHRAIREKWRFKSAKHGQLSAEDLYDIGIGELDNVAVAVSDELDSKASKSFVSKPRPGATKAAAKLEFLKLVIAERLADIEKAENAEASRQMREKIDGIIAEKEDASLRDLSEDELKEMRANL